MARLGPRWDSVVKPFRLEADMEHDGYAVVDRERDEIAGWVCRSSVIRSAPSGRMTSREVTVWVVRDHRDEPCPALLSDTRADAAESVWTEWLSHLAAEDVAVDSNLGLEAIPMLDAVDGDGDLIAQFGDLG